MKEIEIPEGYEARIEGNKVILETKQGGDEGIRKEIADFIRWAIDRGSITNERREKSDAWLAYLEQQKEWEPNRKYECPFTDEQLMVTDFWKEYLKESIIPGNKPTKQDIEFLLPIARKYFSLIMKDVCSICKDWSNGYQKGLDSGKQQPAEWSEEEKMHLANAILAAEKEWGAESCTANFLKSLRPQPQRRDTYYDIIHSILNMLKDIDFMKITPEHRVSLLNDIRVKCKNADECAAILDEPHWKPSEEQMKALQSAIVFVEIRKASDYDISPLKELYEQLKKL